SRRRHTRSYGDWSSDVCSSDLYLSGGCCRGIAVGRIRSREKGFAFDVVDNLGWLGRGDVVIRTAEVITPSPERRRLLAAHMRRRSEERRVGKGYGSRWRGDAGK